MTKFPTTYQEFIYKRSYSRWMDEKKRRENWDETVDRYGIFFKSILDSRTKDEQALVKFQEAIESIRNFEVMPSMRALWTAGKAAERDNVSIYNCCFVAMDKVKRFSEILYILMCGAGCGFSVERQFIVKLPEVPELKEIDETIVFKDSRIGWAEGYGHFIANLYNGAICKWDLSQLRPKGAKLKTFGGRSSGPDPLDQLLRFTLQIFRKASEEYRKLNSLEVHDIVCMIANCVVSGGVRRSSCISLSNLSDMRMAGAKNGEFWIHNDHRRLSNNSVAYTEKPDIYVFTKEWENLMMSKSGERGIFNRDGIKKHLRNLGRRDYNHDFGVNPCAEVVLRSAEFCNLSEIVIRETDSLKDLLKKAEYATILGCIQSTMTNFRFIGNDFKKNCEEERLLGVSLTGLLDHPVLNKNSEHTKEWLLSIKKHVIKVSEKWAKILGINTPVSTTVCKPSGTVSALVNTSSGIHPRFAPYYIRRVRVAATDPISHMLREKGVPCHPEVNQSWANCNTVVFEFPHKSPKSSIIRNQRNAIEQLEYWRTVKECYTEGNPSCTIYVKDHEWLEVGAWVYKNFDTVTGLSFLPFDNSIYPLLPYEEITEETYNSLMAKFPEINFEELANYETDDETEGAKELACTGGVCEL